MEVIEYITLEDVRKAKPAMIFYGADTCWWTHNPAHLCIHPGIGIPCDPRGGVLYETDNVEGFLLAAEEQASHFGKHGIRAFMAAHNQNSVAGLESLEDMRPTCSPDWQDYNDALDRLDKRKKEVTA